MITVLLGRFDLIDIDGSVPEAARLSRRAACLPVCGCLIEVPSDLSVLKDPTDGCGRDEVRGGEELFTESETSQQAVAVKLVH